MRAIVAFVAAVIGVGLLLRGVGDWGLGFLCVAAALIAWRTHLSPLRRSEAALAIALVLISDMRGHPFEGACAAAIVVSLIELARIFR